MQSESDSEKGQAGRQAGRERDAKTDEVQAGRQGGREHGIEDNNHQACIIIVTTIFFDFN